MKKKPTQLELFLATVRKEKGAYLKWAKTFYRKGFTFSFPPKGFMNIPISQWAPYGAVLRCLKMFRERVEYKIYGYRRAYEMFKFDLWYWTYGD